MRGLAHALKALFAAAFAGSALAHPGSSDLSDMFQRGQYLLAAEHAESSNKASDLAFAARALLAQCMTQPEEPSAAMIEQAARDARAALALEPDHSEGKVQLAIALSLKSRAMDAMDVWSSGIGDKGRRLAKEVLKADPQNAYAHGFLAVWNIEVRRRGGRIGAGFMGASLKAARRHYHTASELMPDDVGLHWQYARALIALDADDHRKEADHALDRALAARVNDHVESVMRERAQRLASALQIDPNSAQALARAMR